MKKTLLILFSIVLLSCNSGKVDHPVNIEVDNFIDGLMKEYDIPGLALAVIREGEIQHEKYYGYSDVESKTPVSEETLFQLFSTTKIFSTTAIHQLVEQKKIALDDTVSQYLDDLPDTWNSIKIENLLSHSSGLPNIVKYLKEDLATAKEKVYNDTIQYTCGEKYSYNQTNFWLLDRIAEKIIDKSIPEHVISQQFEGASDATVFEGSSTHITKSRATNYYGYTEEGTLKIDVYDIPKYLLSASGQNITLNGFIQWNQRFDKNILLDDHSKSRLFKKFNYQQPANHAYGWRIRELNKHKSYGYKAGSTTGFRKFPSKELTIIFLANGHGKRMNIEETIDRIAGFFDEELVSQN